MIISTALGLFFNTLGNTHNNRNTVGGIKSWKDRAISFFKITFMALFTVKQFRILHTYSERVSCFKKWEIAWYQGLSPVILTLQRLSRCSPGGPSQQGLHKVSLNYRDFVSKKRERKKRSTYHLPQYRLNCRELFEAMPYNLIRHISICICANMTVKASFLKLSSSKPALLYLNYKAKRSDNVNKILKVHLQKLLVNYKLCEKEIL